MKTTAFTEIHKQFGAKMVPFAGYNMPVEYPTGIKKEHNIVRNGVGVFDVSHMGEFWIKGPKAFDLVQKLTSNDVAKLSPGKIQYSCFPNNEGGIVDDLLVYHYENEKYLLVVNASNIEKDWNWVVKNNTDGVDIENASANISQLAIQGPKAIEALQSLTDVDLSSLTYYTFTVGKFAGIEDVIISATGYTGSGGFEIYMYNNDAVKIWNAIFEAGKKLDIQPIGLGARDTLRLEAGFCLYGNDINDTTSPIEAGLAWITKFVEGNNFSNRAYHEKMKADKPTKRLKGFVLKERGIARHGYEIVDADGKVIGEVTSGTMSPLTNKSIGMGYVASEHAKLGSEIFIKIRKKQIPAEIVKMPFF